MPYRRELGTSYSSALIRGVVKIPLSHLRKQFQRKKSMSAKKVPGTYGTYFGGKFGNTANTHFFSLKSQIVSSLAMLGQSAFQA